MSPDELKKEVARRMQVTVGDIINLKGKELSEDYVTGYCQGCLDYLETLATIIIEQN